MQHTVPVVAAVVVAVAAMAGVNQIVAKAAVVAMRKAQVVVAAKLSM